MQDPQVFNAVIENYGIGDNAEALKEVTAVLRRALPSGWTDHVASSGKLYFYNANTDESTFIHPYESEVQELLAKFKLQQASSNQVVDEDDRNV
jgi:hypothetical protein